MGFFDTLERLQHSSLATRRMILVISVIIIMSAIIGIWSLQLKYELREEAAAPSLADNFGSVWKSIKERAPTFSQ